MVLLKSDQEKTSHLFSIWVDFIQVPISEMEEAEECESESAKPEKKELKDKRDKIKNIKLQVPTIDISEFEDEKEKGPSK